MKTNGTAIDRLRAALQRLMSGKPVRVKLTGKLTLNKINNEAGLGNSYIHKFKEFIESEAKPAIETFNSDYDPIRAKLLGNETELSEVEKLKVKLKKEIALKEQYRQERNEMISINKKLEAQNSTLMFRTYELQEQVNAQNVVKLSR